MPKIVDHEARRTQIADAALELIAESGIGAVTFRSLATTSGWSPGVLGHYFKDRHDILTAAITRAADLSAVQQKAISGTMNGRQALEALLEETLPIDNRRLALTRVFVFFYAEAAVDSKTKEMIDIYLNRWRKLTARSVVDAQTLGDLDASLDPTATAMDLVAYVDGLSVHALFNEEVLRRIQSSSPVRAWVNHLRSRE